MTLLPPSQKGAAAREPQDGFPRTGPAPEPSRLVVPAAEQAFETFSYAVSHDLRAPLRAIEGYARALTEDYAGQLPPQAQEFVDRIRSATQTVEQRVDALLRLSRLSRGALRVAHCDLAEAAGHVLDDLRRTEPTRVVTTAIASSIPVFGDVTLLGIAIENLLSNAWKFTRTRREARITVEAAPADDEVVVIVRDNGPGFDMRHAHRLGVPFQRLHTGEPVEGMGIGLASTRRIIERHGGRLWAEGVPGQGAAFYVSLPTVRTT